MGQAASPAVPVVGFVISADDSRANDHGSAPQSIVQDASFEANMAQGASCSKTLRPAQQAQVTAAAVAQQHYAEAVQAPNHQTRHSAVVQPPNEQFPSLAPATAVARLPTQATHQQDTRQIPDLEPDKPALQPVQRHSSASADAALPQQPLSRPASPGEQRAAAGAQSPARLPSWAQSSTMQQQVPHHSPALPPAPPVQLPQLRSQQVGGNAAQRWERNRQCDAVLLREGTLRLTPPKFDSCAGRLACYARKAAARAAAAPVAAHSWWQCSTAGWVIP